FDVVIGHDVADRLGYKVGDNLVLSHGTASVTFEDHDNLPFKVSGILEATRTPVDRVVLVGLEAIEAIHVGWEDGMPDLTGGMLTMDQAQAQNLTPKSITAFVVGL